MTQTQKKILPRKGPQQDHPFELLTSERAEPADVDAALAILDRARDGPLDEGDEIFEDGRAPV